MTQKEKDGLLKGLNSNMSDLEIYGVIDGIFEKVLQTAVHPLAVIPASTWQGWDKFVNENKIQEKFTQLLTDMAVKNTSSFIVLPSKESNRKVDIFTPVSSGQMVANRNGTELTKTVHVIADEINLIYGAPAGTSMVSFIKKGNSIVTGHNAITGGNGSYDYEKAFNAEGLKHFSGRYIPIVWFTDKWFTLRQRALVNNTKKAAFKILKEILAMLPMVGPNIMFMGSANNSTTQATQQKKAILEGGARVHTINESLNRVVSNPVMSINNQPYFQEFWALIETMLNDLVEGLQLPELNQSGKGTAQTHSTEVVAAFGVKATKLMNIQKMFLSSWELLAKVLRDNGVSLPANTSFSYDGVENLVLDSVRATTEDIGLDKIGDTQPTNVKKDGE